MEIYKMSEPVILKNKKVGEIKWDKEKKFGVYYTDRNPELHYMRLYCGYGISQSVLDYLFKRGVSDIVIRAKGEIYNYRLSEFTNSDLCYNFEGKDFQRFVSLPGKASEGKVYNSVSASRVNTQKEMTDYFK